MSASYDAELAKSQLEEIAGIVGKLRNVPAGEAAVLVHKLQSGVDHLRPMLGNLADECRRMEQGRK